MKTQNIVLIIVCTLIIVCVVLMFNMKSKEFKAQNEACQDLGTEKFSKIGFNLYCVNGTDYYPIDMEYEGWFGHTARFINIMEANRK